jgi:alpha-1,6-mannosyltransferase
MPTADIGPGAGPLRHIDPARRLRLIVVLAVAASVSVGLGLQSLQIKSHDGYVLAILVHGLVYAPAVWVVTTARLPQHAMIWILVIAAALRAIAFVAPVGITTDAYRYVWDGRLQAAGVNPFLTVPADPRLNHLQDTSVYPNINGKETYPTIYPPLAQITFLIATRIHDSINGIKAMMMLIEAGIIAALIGWLSAVKLPRERVLIYAWHPLPLWEFTGHGHIDAVAVLCVTLAMFAAARGRTGWAGAAFAGAALVKYWPAYLAAAIWQRWDWRMPLVAAITVVLLAIPYLWPQIYGFGFAAVTPEKLLGSLFKHLHDEGYNDAGWGFFLAYAPKHFGWWTMSGSTYGKLAAAALVSLGFWAALKTKTPTFPAWLPLTLIGAFLLLISPHYPWYYAIAVPLLTLCLYPPLLYVTLVISLVYIEIDYIWLTPYPRFKAYCIVYGGFLLLAAMTWAASQTSTGERSTRL